MQSAFICCSAAVSERSPSQVSCKSQGPRQHDSPLPVADDRKIPRADCCFGTPQLPAARCSPDCYGTPQLIENLPTMAESELERRRRENLARNRELLGDFNLVPVSVALPAPPSKVAPSRSVKKREKPSAAAAGTNANTSPHFCTSATCLISHVRSCVDTMKCR